MKFGVDSTMLKAILKTNYPYIYAKIEEIGDTVDAKDSYRGGQRIYPDSYDFDGELDEAGNGTGALTTRNDEGEVIRVTEGEIRGFRFEGIITETVPAETRTRATFRAGVKSGLYRTATVHSEFKVSGAFLLAYRDIKTVLGSMKPR